MKTFKIRKSVVCVFKFKKTSKTYIEMHEQVFTWILKKLNMSDFIVYLLLINRLSQIDFAVVILCFVLGRIFWSF